MAINSGKLNFKFQRTDKCGMCVLLLTWGWIVMHVMDRRFRWTGLGRRQILLVDVKWSRDEAGTLRASTKAAAVPAVCIPCTDEHRLGDQSSSLLKLQNLEKWSSYRKGLAAYQATCF